ncbi:Kinase-like protein [Melia azedarach]|uniref:Kinase-like protein n=1 Tax=Melia azedarach TaxID=155640 RepID=A0ACC1YBS8_MELAZ|nr:Kinase-like protein [Melia azedarach]
MFQGSIPPSLGSLKGIIDLDLSCNNLSGKIPKELEILPFLENLNLVHNNFEGLVPSKGVFTKTSVISVAGNSKLCGGVPELRSPACAIEDFKKQNHPFGIKFIVIIITLSLCLMLVMLLVTVFWKIKPRRLSVQSLLGEEFLRISYDELLKAADGFSSANLIGVGSFGCVYKGKLQQDGKPVAVKVFNLERLGASKSFVAECEALRKTRHRDLLKILTACSSINFKGNDFKALVFEFMPNGSLESWLHPSEDTRKLDLPQRLNIAVDVVTALEYLHHHCEIPIVGDFGLPRFLFINIKYGRGGSASKQGDVYSYGILPLEILTGKRPTDEMFTDGLSLHNFCKMALPDRVMEIVDPHLLQEVQIYETNRDAGDERYIKAKNERMPDL